MTKQTVITDEGLKKLEKELEELKTVKRKEVAEKIKVALSFGDLSENSEYDEAKNDQAIIEGRIAEIENQLKNVKILDESEIGTESVHIGSTVKVKDMDGYACPGAGKEFETESFKKNDVVAYTYSNKAGENSIQSMALAEKVTGAMSTYTISGNVTVGGTK